MKTNAKNVRNATPSGPSQKKSTYSREETLETYVVVPPDGGYGWLVVAASFLCNFLADGSMYTFGIFLEDISETLRCSDSQVTLSSSIQNGCYNMSGPLVCALTNRFGFRVVAITGALVTALSYGLTSFVTSLSLFSFTHGFIGGLGFGMLYIPSIIIVGFYFEKWRPLATSVIVTGSAVGTIAFPPLFKIVLKKYTWRMKFRLLCAMSLFLCFCGATYRALKPVKVVRVGEKKSVVLSKFDMYSLGSSTATSSIFTRYHNTAYPTAAEVYKQGPFVVYDTSPTSSEVSIPSTSGVSMKSTRTGVVSVLSKMPVSESEKLQTILEDHEDLNKCQIFCITCRRKCCARRHTAPFRPMYRDDALLVQSIAAMSQYSTTADRKGMDYHMSVTRVTTPEDEEEDYIPCICCPKSVKRTLATMLDFSLMRSPSFILLAVSGFMSTLGVYIPYLYLVEATTKQGQMDPKISIYLMTVLGGANAVGRLSCGLLSFFPSIKVLEFSTASLFLAGIMTCLSTISYDRITQFVYVIVYGGGLAVVAATRPLIVVDLVGLEKLTNAFGLTVMFQGFACFVGIPVAGFLLETSGDYRIPFHFSGVAIIIASLLLGFIKTAQKWEKSRRQ